MYRFFQICLLLLVSSCGIAIIDGENSGSMQNEGMTTSSPSTTATTTATQTTATETTTETTTETDTEPPVEPELIISLLPTDGPNGAAIEYMMVFELYAPNHSVQVDSMTFTYASTDGAGCVKGSAGTDYFGSNQITDVVTGSLFAGPLDINAVDDGKKVAELVFTDAFVVPQGQPVTLVFTSILSLTNDLPGEFVGNQYMLVLNTGEISGMVLGKPLVQEQVSPKENLERQFQIDFSNK
jgi:hypothetical protein